MRAVACPGLIIPTRLWGPVGRCPTPAGPCPNSQPRPPAENPQPARCRCIGQRQPVNVSCRSSCRQVRGALWAAAGACRPGPHLGQGGGHLAGPKCHQRSSAAAAAAAAAVGQAEQPPRYQSKRHQQQGRQEPRQHVAGPAAVQQMRLWPTLIKDSFVTEFTQAGTVATSSTGPISVRRQESPSVSPLRQHK